MLFYFALCVHSSLRLTPYIFPSASPSVLYSFLPLLPHLPLMPPFLYHIDCPLLQSFLSSTLPLLVRPSFPFYPISFLAVTYHPISFHVIPSHPLPPLYLPILSYPIQSITCYFSHLGSESPCHQDPFHNILCQVYGTKHVLLFPPEQHVCTHA
jgi:Cupin-like domain